MIPEPEARPRWTRRHWFREVCDRGWAGYLDLTSMLRGSSGKYSMTRLLVAGFGVRFMQNWPEVWGPHSVTAMAILIFALPVDALLARVPGAEALGAVQSFFSMLAQRAAAKGTEYLDRARSLRQRKQEEEPAGDPVTPPAHS